MISRLIPLSYQILIWQIIAHVFSIYGLWVITNSFVTPMWLIASLAIFILINGLGNSVGYHRLFSHNSFVTSDFWHKIILFIATLGATGPSITWVALHRQHHVAPDTSADPHSPTHLGFFRVHFLSMFLPLDIRYAKDLLRRPIHRFQYNHYSMILVAYVVLVYCLGSSTAVIFMWAIPSVLNWHAGSSVLSWQHRGGHPHDNTVVALMTCGEGYHESHHRNSRNPRFGKWDLGYAFVYILKK